MTVTVPSQLAAADSKSTPASELVQQPEPTSQKAPLDFFWTETDEWHMVRRRAILEKHPEMRELFTVEPRTFWIVLGLFFVQLAAASWAVNASNLMFFIVAYALGGTVNHSLQLAVHELSHNLCFHTPIYNQVLAIFANFVTGMPSAVTFQKYHMEHHQAQGVPTVDVDIPSDWEVRFFKNSTPMKLLWVILQPFFYAFRPLVIAPKPISLMVVVNFVCQACFDAAVVYFLGWRALAYLVSGTFLGLGLHPSAGHFIAEHYVFMEGVETYSYYGPWNYVNFNVGYHVEHHDFPKVPWSNLPRVREIAPEFYNRLPFHTSYVRVIWNYIMDPTIGPFSRVKRLRVKKGL